MYQTNLSPAKSSLPFGFIDETGLGYPDQQQPFLGIGLFKIYNTQSITNTLLKEYYQQYSTSKQRQSRRVEELASRLASRLASQSRRKQLNSHSSTNLTFAEISKLLQVNPNYEYKFENITSRTLHKYTSLFDALFEYHWSFSCILIDKTHETFDPTIYKNYWNGYLTYTKLLVKNSTKGDQGISLIADFLGQPKNMRQTFETEMLRLPCVVNAMQADSRSMMHLQIVDLLLGAVAFHAKRRKEFSKGVVISSKRGSAKELFVSHLLAKLNITANTTNQYPLANNLTIRSPCHFNVWNVKFDTH